jgi:hypothetical protein
MRNIVMGKRRGVAIIYMLVIFTALVGFASLAVDGGRYYLTHTQLQRAADAAARYGASGLVVGETLPNTTEGTARAAAAAADNNVNGQQVVPADGDVTYYSYDLDQQGLTPLDQPPYAIQVTLRCTIPLLFGKMLGISSGISEVATATAVIRPEKRVSNNAAATNNLWLAGAPDGRTANIDAPGDGVNHNHDVAGQHWYSPTTTDPGGHWANVTPQPVTGIPLVGGAALAFDSIDGTANNNQAGSQFGPDGDLSDGGLADNKIDGAENGISDIISPMNAVIGVFLDDNDPESYGSPPSTLDFSTDDKRNFATLRPQLRQVFFIGDGLMNDKVTQQHFIVPEGATRLFLGNMDRYEWNNNTGTRTTTVIQPASIMLVSNKLAQVTQTPPPVDDSGGTSDGDATSGDGGTDGSTGGDTAIDGGTGSNHGNGHGYGYGNGHGNGH